MIPEGQERDTGEKDCTGKYYHIGNHEDCTGANGVGNTFRQCANGKASVEQHDREFDEARCEHIETFVGQSNLYRAG